ncbi:hypothetical protein DRH14_02630 [Candidatus Shapirobacteria bacterium]|nr:MAG: hypothetical protein DRH14_02630 [Candidatus Shapirobacteria bacterium]
MKKIIKLSLLLIIRQVWLWLCNLYLLSYEPFNVLKKIKEDRDKSQFLLVGGSLSIPMLIYVVMRLITDPLLYGSWLMSVGSIFKLAILLELLGMAYLIYWTNRVLRS